MQQTTHRRRHRSLAELNLLDDFLFQEIVSQKETGEEFCRILLRTILNRPIRNVRIIPQKNILGIDTDRHGIRLDAYIEDLSFCGDTPSCSSSQSGGIDDLDFADAEIIPDIYDIEPNNTSEKQSLPKRMRYYHGLIDTQILDRGTGYKYLPNVIIITILPYDPFGKNRMVYTILNRCMEDASIPYDDGAKKIFLYTRGTAGNPSQALRDMLKYMEMTTDEHVTNQDIASVHKLVKTIKHNKEVGINYMKSWEREAMIRNEGRLEGKIEGKIEVLLEILAEHGNISPALISKIEAETDPDTLRRWTRLAISAANPAEFEEQM